MTRVLIAAAVVVLACIAAYVSRRRRPEPPTQAKWSVPQQLDRADFADPAAPWIVVAFTSATCDTCAGVVGKVEPLRSHAVAVDVVEYPGQRATHERYAIDAVPTLVIADDAGVVRRSFVGAVTATDLWAAVAEVREPGSTPPPDAHRPA